MLDITNLFNRASNAVVAAIDSPGTTWQKNFVVEGPLAKYEWLYKDAPCLDGRPLIHIDTDPMAAGSQHHIRIELGRVAVYPMDPAETLSLLAGRADRDKTFHLTAMFFDIKHDWPLELGFRRLAEFLATFSKLPPYPVWTELTLHLPLVEVPYDDSAPPIIPLNTLKNLQILRWHGDRHQLRFSWLPFTPTFLQTESLTTLHVSCDLALQDCAYILHHGIGLKEVNFYKISGNYAQKPVLPFEASGAIRVERPKLESLILASDHDIVPLLQPFSFPSLRSLDLWLSYSVVDFHNLDIWGNLQTVKLECRLSHEAHDWIRSQCPPTADIHHFGHPLGW